MSASSEPKDMRLLRTEEQEAIVASKNRIISFDKKFVFIVCNYKLLGVKLRKFFEKRLKSGIFVK